MSERRTLYGEFSNLAEAHRRAKELAVQLDAEVVVTSDAAVWVVEPCPRLATLVIDLAWDATGPLRDRLEREYDITTRWLRDH